VQVSEHRKREEVKEGGRRAEQGGAGVQHRKSEEVKEGRKEGGQSRAVRVSFKRLGVGRQKEG